MTTIGRKWDGKKVLLTGAAGFIGSHLLERLVRLGADVTAFIRYNSRGSIGLMHHLSEDIADSFRIIRGDLKDPSAVSRAVKGNETVFSLGALIGIPYSYVHPMDYVQTNVVGTAHILDAALSYEVERVVHTSTSEVYGTAQYVPIDESHPLQGQSPYSASKIAADQLALSYHLSFNLPVSVIRPFNTYGPRQSSRAVIPTIITQALQKGAVHLGALSPTRDFTFVTDTVEGFIKVAESDDTIGNVTNVGSGKEISIGDLAKKIFTLMNIEPQITTEENRFRPEKSEVQRLLAATGLAEKRFGWKPSVSLNEGLNNTIRWMKTSLDSFNTRQYHV